MSQPPKRMILWFRKAYHFEGRVLAFYWDILPIEEWVEAEYIYRRSFVIEFHTASLRRVLSALWWSLRNFIRVKT